MVKFLLLTAGVFLLLRGAVCIVMMSTCGGMMGPGMMGPYGGPGAMMGGAYGTDAFRGPRGVMLPEDMDSAMGQYSGAGRMMVQPKPLPEPSVVDAKAAHDLLGQPKVFADPLLPRGGMMAG